MSKGSIVTAKVLARKKAFARSEIGVPLSNHKPFNASVTRVPIKNEPLIKPSTAGKLNPLPGRSGSTVNLINSARQKMRSVPRQEEGEGSDRFKN